MARILPAAMAILLSSASLEASDWALPSLSQSLAEADAVVIGKILATTQPSADPQGPHKATVDVEVQERFKGETPQRITIKDLDLGDPTGIRSPFGPLPAALENVRLILLLKPTDQKGVYQAMMRYEVVDQEVRQVMLEGQSVDTADLAVVRAIISQLVLIQSALTAADNSAQPPAAGLDLAACRVALFSRHAEVVWFACGQAMKRHLCKSLLNELQAAGRIFGQETPTGQLLRRCLDQAKT